MTTPVPRPSPEANKAATKGCLGLLGLPLGVLLVVQGANNYSNDGASFTGMVGLVVLVVSFATLRSLGKKTTQKGKQQFALARNLASDQLAQWQRLDGQNLAQLWQRSTGREPVANLNEGYQRRMYGHVVNIMRATRRDGSQRTQILIPLNGPAPKMSAMRRSPEDWGLKGEISDEALNELLELSPEIFNISVDGRTLIAEAAAISGASGRMLNADMPRLAQFATALEGALQQVDAAAARQQATTGPVHQAAQQQTTGQASARKPERDEPAQLGGGSAALESSLLEPIEIAPFEISSLRTSTETFSLPTYTPPNYAQPTYSQPTFISPSYETPSSLSSTLGGSSSMPADLGKWRATEPWRDGGQIKIGDQPAPRPEKRN